MTEILNLSALCRCCHANGEFKNIFSAYLYGNEIESYSIMLRDTFGIFIGPPQSNISSTICENCIVRLRDGLKFKKMVLACEEKLEEYIKNEQFVNFAEGNIKVEDPWEIEIKHDSDNDLEIGFREYNDAERSHKVSTHDVKEEDDKNTIEMKIDVQVIPTEDAENVKTPRKCTKDKSPISPSLVVHKKTEDGDAFFCKLCKASYKKRKYLMYHIKKKHIESKKKREFYCEVCKRGFYYRSKLLIHLNSHKTFKEFRCHICNKNFKAKGSLSDHVNSHTQQNIFQCDICQKRFYYKQVLRRHLLWHMGKNKTCVCDICGASFNDRTNMYIHVRTVHEKLRPFKCEFCPKKFSAKKHLTEHTRKHTGERPYVCEVCAKTFTSSSNLSAHKKIHERLISSGADGVKRAGFICRFCGEEFEERGLYRSHLNTHDEKKPYQCNLCYKDFFSPFALNRHISEHDGVKKFACVVCEKMFVQESSLNKHLVNLHSPVIGLEKKKCQYCKMSVRDIEKHEQTHVRRPYHCETCGKTYPQRNAFNRHLKRHLGQTFDCQGCRKTYATASGLRKHNLKCCKDVDAGHEDKKKSALRRVIKRERKRTKKLKIERSKECLLDTDVENVDL